MSFERAVNFTLGEEGGYQCEPSDAGNWTKAGRKGELKGTKYGISALSFPSLDIKNLTVEQAKDIYRKGYWDKVEGDKLSPPLAVAVFDTAVNMGVATAVRLLQRAIGCKQDGILGPITLQTAQDKGDKIIPRFLALRVDRCSDIVGKDPLMKQWGLGWYIRCVRLAMECAR